jgi:hypothetical protein
VLPPAVASDVELASLMLRSCPFIDQDELLPICYRCQATNTLLNTQVIRCCLVRGCCYIYIYIYIYITSVQQQTQCRKAKQPWTVDLTLLIN